VEPAIRWFAQALHELGLKPNHITGLSFSCSLLAACSFVILTDHILRGILAGILLLLSGLFDATDGLMARIYGEESHFGAFFDSVLDRVSEIAVYWAAIYSNLVDWSIGFIALSGSLMVSYSRARAEQLGSEMKGVGIAERPERLLILAASALLNQLNAGALLIAVLSIVTLLQRIVHAGSTLVDTQHIGPEREAAD